MNKKQISLLFASVLSFGGQDVMAAQDGVYIGIDAAYEMYDNSLSIGGTGINLSADIEPEGAAVGVFLGYRQGLGRFQMAVEARYGYSFADDNVPSVIGDSYEFSVGNAFSLSLLPGFKLTENLLFYGRLGYVSSQYEEKVTEGLAIYTYKDYQDGFEYGGGLQLDVTKNISIRAEYTQTDYKDVDYNLNGVDYKLDVDRNRFLLGILVGL